MEKLLHRRSSGSAALLVAAALCMGRNASASPSSSPGQVEALKAVLTDTSKSVRWNARPVVITSPPHQNCLLPSIGTRFGFVGVRFAVYGETRAGDGKDETNTGDARALTAQRVRRLLNVVEKTFEDKIKSEKDSDGNNSLHIMCEIRDQVSDWFYENNLYVYVKIPPQDLVKTAETAEKDNQQNAPAAAGDCMAARPVNPPGYFTLCVIPAYIHAVRPASSSVASGNSDGASKANSRSSNDKRIFDLLNTLKDQPFELSAIERQILLADDLGGRSVHITLADPSSAGGGQAGAAHDGGLDLVVNLVGDPLHGEAVVRNTGSGTQGPWSGMLRLEAPGLPSVGDHTSLFAYSTIGYFEQEVFGVEETRHLGRNGFYLDGAFTYGKSDPGGQLSPLNLTGYSYVGTLKLGYPIVRSLRLNISAIAGFDFIGEKSSFPGGGVLTDDTLRIAWARIQEDWSTDLLGKATIVAGGRNAAPRWAQWDHSIQLEVRKGLEILGASHAEDPNLSRILGRADAAVVKGAFDTDFKLDPDGPAPITLGARLQAQWADRPLLAYEEQPLGNYTIGRGFDPGVQSGDRAVAVEFKLSVGPLARYELMTLTPYAFYDIGRAYNLAPGSVDTTLQSTGAVSNFGLESVAKAPHVFSVIWFTRGH